MQERYTASMSEAFFCLWTWLSFFMILLKVLCVFVVFDVMFSWCYTICIICLRNSYGNTPRSVSFRFILNPRAALCRNLLSPVNCCCSSTRVLLDSFGFSFFHAWYLVPGARGFVSVFPLAALLTYCHCISAFATANVVFCSFWIDINVLLLHLNLSYKPK